MDFCDCTCQPALEYKEQSMNKLVWVSDVGEEDAGKIQRTFPDLELGKPKRETGWENKPLIGIYQKLKVKAKKFKKLLKQKVVPEIVVQGGKDDDA